jgi:teichuronic acid biosynthesis protein TuaE
MRQRSLSDILRWTFLLMLPAAVLGSVAAWPQLRTISLFRILFVVLSIEGAIWVLLNRRLPRGVHVRAPLIFLGLWVLWTLLSLSWAADKGAAVRYSIFLAMMVSVSAGTVPAISNLRTLRVALFLLLLVFGVGLFIALLEITAGFRLPTSALIDLPERFQWAVTAFFHNQNDFATYIALWLPFLVAIPFITRSASTAAAAAICAVASVICLLYTGSRTNLLALGFAFPTLLVLLALRKGTTSTWWQWLLGMGLISAVLCVGYLGMSGALPIVRLPGIGIQHWRFDTLGAEIEAQTGSGGTRIKLTEGGLALARASRFLGVGPGNAEYHLRHMPGLETVHNLHNWWLEVLVNGGIFIFVGYLSFYAYLVYNLFMVATKTKTMLIAWVASALFAALLGYTLGSLSPSSAIHFTPMWIHFGLSLAVVNLYRKREPEVNLTA